MEKEVILYHYTSVEAANKILASGKLWASDCRFLNDRQEYKNAETEFLSLFENEEERKILEMAFHLHTFSNFPFIFSLSKSPKVLSQWRAYGDDAQGIALGFSSNFIVSQSRNMRSVLVKCVYEDHSNFIKELQSKYAKHVSEIIELYEKAGRAYNTFADHIKEHGNLIFDLKTQILRVKNKAFKEEQEWRLVVDADYNQTHRRTSKNLIIPYVEYPYLKEKGHSYLSIVIPEIWLGPKCDDRNKDALTSFQQLGWVVNKSVSKFDCGYI